MLQNALNARTAAALYMHDSTMALRLQLLQWLTARPRTYAETLEAWRTSCPRLSIWEDACIDGLIDSSGGTFVSLSPKGQLLLDEAAAVRTVQWPAK
jgi:hypothetical protein